MTHSYPGEGCNTQSPRIKTHLETLQERKALLINQIQMIDEGIEALAKNPELAKAIDAIELAHRL